MAAVEKSSAPSCLLKDAQVPHRSPCTEQLQLLRVQTAHRFLNGRHLPPTPSMPFLTSPALSSPLSFLSPTSWSFLSFRAQLRHKVAAFPDHWGSLSFPYSTPPTGMIMPFQILVALCWYTSVVLIRVIWAGVSSPIRTVSFQRTYSS